MGRNYFFHRTAVSDGELLTRLVSLTQGETVPVVFNVADSPRGPLAVGVSMSRSVDERLELATRYANDGDYPKAIAMIRQVLATNPEHQVAREFYEKWREYARVTGVPRGVNPYARAKRVQLIEHDPERAAQLLEQAIQQGDSV